MTFYKIEIQPVGIYTIAISPISEQLGQRLLSLNIQFLATVFGGKPAKTSKFEKVGVVKSLYYRCLCL